MAATMGQIEEAAKEYAEWRAELGMLCVDFQREVQALQARSLPEIKKRVAAAKAAHARLGALIQESPELFVKPRSVVLHGIKLGYQKQKGAMVIEDEAKTVALIKKHFPDQAEVLISTTEKPAKKALEQLPVADLKKVAVLLTETGDVVFAKDAAAEVDKLVAAFLKDEVEEAEQQQPERAAA